jgi:hypothetical protein
MISILSSLLSSMSSKYSTMASLHTMHTHSHPFCSKLISSSSLATLLPFHSCCISLDIQANSLVVLARYRE